MKYELYNDLVDFFEYHRFEYGKDFEEKMTQFMETAEKYEVQYYISKEVIPVNVRVECEIYEDHPGYETYHRNFKSKLEKGRVFMYSDVTKQHLDLDYEKPLINMTGTIVDIESSLPAGWENKVTPISIEEYFQKKIDYKINVCKESIESPTEVEAKANIYGMFEDHIHELLQFIEDTNDELGLKINHLTDLKSKTESYLHENKIIEELCDEIGSEIDLDITTGIKI